MEEIIFNDLANKVVLITGATSGIGKASAQLFSKLGMKVIAAARDKQKGEMLVKEVKELGGEILFVRTDVSNFKEVKELIRKTIEHFGTLDYALNSAGIEGSFKPISETDEEEYDSVININLKGIWNCLKFQAPLIAKAGGGAIINVSSSITRNALEGSSIYTASKAAVQALTKVVAMEYGKQKVRINAIAPGAVKTPMLKRLFPKGFEDLSADNPLKKIAIPEDIAKAAIWLFSSMSGHVNGETIFIDGGSSLK